MVQHTVKLEVDHVTDSSEIPPRCKKTRVSSTFHNQSWSSAATTLTDVSNTQQAFVNPLDEPSPLGLTLKKTPSLLDLIQMKLSQGDPMVSGSTNALNQDAGKRKDGRSCAPHAGVDKLKASNFPVSILKIGTWECKSRYEGDLVAKCYFAKHKLVWEVLEGGLKSKIEIQWSDITALKANFPENEPSTFEIEVSRPPSFFKETNPQPRKHTLWQATSDFTGGQASICRRHFLQCPHGLLNRHYDKLIQCDPRLNLLSSKSILSKDPPYFEPRSAIFHERDDQSFYGKVQTASPHMIPQLDQMKNEYISTLPCFEDATSSITAALVPKIEPTDAEMRTIENASQETPSPSSVMDTRAIEEHANSDSDEHNVKGAAQWESLKLAAPINCLLPQDSESSLSTSVSNLTNQVSMHSQDEIHSCPHVSLNESDENQKFPNKSVFDEIAQNLLSDSFLSTAPDEQAVLGRVNSLLSLFQKDLSSIQSSERNGGNSDGSAPMSENILSAQKKFLDEITQNLLSDNLLSSSDEQSVMARVNSLRCLLQKDTSVTHGPDSGLGRVEESVTTYELGSGEESRNGGDITSQRSPLRPKNVMESKQPTPLPRKESAGDLLLHLPRIASLPQFFINVSDELMEGNEPAEAEEGS